MTDKLPEVRRSHPYVMYDMMRDIPNGIDRTLSSMEKIDLSFLGDHILFLGNGTAYHSAYVGSQILDETARRHSVVQAYEYLNYMRSSATTIAVSHTGKTKSTVDAAIKARKTSITAGITHYADSPLSKAVDHPITIADEDLSLCNTKAFFNNAFAALYISDYYGNLSYDMKALRSEIVKHVSSDDAEMKTISEDLDHINDIFVLGSGYNFPVAREAAQKIKEATHMHAEGIEFEEFNHGCTAVMDDHTLVILIEGQKDRSRGDQIVRASRYVGSTTLVINGEGDLSIYNDPPDEFSASFLNTLDLYYLAYYLAVRRNINPDMLRFEDRRYRDYDSTVFPPGEH
ncbi:glucosamine 6-phosphate synthase [Thermoplasma sp. Kam2015]|uniref:SIS domain-containing protein n=1 Tax=Thermoplasma sp. Kam2015 TaxID=2094122 RepID=UPI000D89E8C3|nr:SIS domain-containing protein [Thermoplasma sp. Kam2015]PYB68745.1 glucosamine 6-phosphate synthase [Thermoplasma sp. Kam2015]